MIEIKRCHNYKIMAQKVSNLFEKYNLYDKAVVGSFFPFPLYRCRELNPKIVTLLLVRDYLITKETLHLIPKEKNFLIGFLLKIIDDLVFWSYLTWLPSFFGSWCDWF